MATTANDVFGIAMDLIDERLENGVINSSGTGVYRAKTPGILNLLQAELIKEGEVFATYEIANKPIENLFGSAAEFGIMEFKGEDFTRECLGSARAYYFEVDRVGTVYVEDFNGTWNTLATIITTNTPAGFTAYKGIVTPSSGATKSRLRFSGSYYYRTANRALFSVPFASANDVPDYRPWIKHTMPSDFDSIHEIVAERAPNSVLPSYAKDAFFKWEGKNKLYISYYFDGNLRITYHPVPSKISNMTDTLQVDDVTARTILPYGLAAHLMLDENPAIASFFNGRYEELKRDAARKQPASIESIANLYGPFE